MKRLVRALIVTAIVTSSTLLAVPPGGTAQAVPGHTALVPQTPRTDTPRVEANEILDIETSGSRVYLAGTFTSIRDANGTSVSQRYLAAYDINTGRLDMGFRPTFDGSIAAVEASPDGTALYIAGNFNTVNGVRRRKIARLNPTTGATVTAFTANANSRATAIAVSSTTVYVGGFFSTVNGVSRGRLVGLNPANGAVDAMNLPITEGIGSGGVLKVMQLQLTSDDAALLVVHTGRRVAGLPHTGIALITTATRSLRPWHTTLFDDNLARVGGVLRVTNGDIAPNNQYFVVVSGSGGDRPPINDTAMAFPMAGAAGVEPLWISRHFDSVYSVAISEVAVYTGGHFRWQESPLASDPWPGDADISYGWGNGLGAAVFGDEVVRRDTIGALDPATGKALSWNPGANPFEGVKALELTPRGLLIGQDGTMIGGRSVGRHGFLDFTRVPPPEPAETTITDPFTGGTVPAGTSTRFEGRASAASEVRRVQVELRNLDNRRYLQDDGTSWSTTFNQFTATLEQLNATETGWSFEAILPAGEYQLRARAIGKDGTQDSTWATARFDSMLIGDLPPETSIALPPSGQVSTLTFLVSGTARDDSGVMRLSMFARNANTGAYLQDDWTARATWHSFPITPDNPGDPSVTWSYEVTMPEGEWDVNVSASDDAGQSEIRGASRTYFVSATNVAPTVTMTTPAPNTVVTPGSTLFIAGTASDDTALRRVEVYVRNRQTREGMAVDGSWGVPDWHLVTPTSLNVLSTSWTVTTPPLPAGSYEVRAQAIDGHGVTTPSSLRPNITVMSAVAGDAQPDTTLSFTGTTQDIETLTLPITGTATDDRGVGGVRLVVSDSVTGRYLASPAGGFTSAYTMLPASLASPGATSTGFSLTLPLGVPGTYNVTAIAQDNAGQWDTATTGATARYLIYPGDAVPYLDLDSPDPEQVVTNFITFGGRAHDDVGVQRVQVRVVNSAGYSLNSTGTFVSTETWITAFVTNPGGTGSNFNYATPNLAAGPYTAYARAIDSVGQVQPTPNRATVHVVLG